LVDGLIQAELLDNGLTGFRGDLGVGCVDVGDISRLGFQDNKDQRHVEIEHENNLEQAHDDVFAHAAGQELP
jgi:hypothetical protein